MIRHLLRLIVLCACATMSAESAAQNPTGPSDADAMNEKARDLFNEGNRHFRDEKWAQAEAAFEAAHALSPTSRCILNNLGQAELHLKKHREAAEHLATALRLLAQDDARRAAIATDLALAKKSLCTLTVEASVPGTEVFVGERSFGKAPLVDPVFVEPGSVTVRGLLEGYESAVVSLDAKAGQELPVPLAMKKPSVPTATGVPTTVPPPSRVPSYVAFGVGGAGLVLGVVAGAVVIAKTDALAATCTPDRVCSSNARSDFNEATTLAHVSTTGLVIAGVGAVLGTTLLFLPKKKDAPATTGVAIGPGFVGVKGAF